MPCIDTDPDPNLHDECISIQDGPGAIWWMSPDINLNGFSDQAMSGGNNTVDITVHRKPDTCTFLEGTKNVIVEVWVSPPGLNLSPVGAKNIGTKLMPLSQLPANGSRSLSQVGQLINWTPTSTNPGDPDGPGHRCLISRCYPELDGPAQPDCFHVLGDSHVAQRNIQIVGVPAPRHGLKVPIHTGNNNREAAQPATLRVAADLKPSEKVLEILKPGLRHAKGFRRVSHEAPGHFSLHLPDFPDAKIRDCTGPDHHHTPSYEADVEFKAGQVTKFTFTADLSKSKAGDAHLFHLTHSRRSDKRVIGGLTVVAVVD